MTVRDRFLATDYHLLKRRKKDGRVVYYAGFLDVTTGKNGRPTYRAMRSTGAGNRALAHKIARQMIAEGSVFAARDDLRRFLLGFWDPDQSEYLRSRQAEGRVHATAYIEANQTGIKRHFLPYFEERGKSTLADVTPAALEGWRNWLRLDKGASPNTVNRVRSCVWTALQWAVDVGLLPYHPGARVKKLPTQHNKRAIFELAELAQLFSAAWTDMRVYTACMVASTTGMRMGEVRGLLCRNLRLEEGYIDVVTNYVDGGHEGLKPPKWGSERVGVPVRGKVADALRAVLQVHRWDAQPDNYVFFSIDGSNRPVAASTIARGLSNACEAAGVAPGRTFHCFRHTFISHASRHLAPAMLRAQAGHSADSTVHEAYQHPTAEDQTALVNVQQMILGGQS